MRKESSHNDGNYINSSRKLINKIYFNEEMNSRNLWLNVIRIKVVKFSKGVIIAGGNSLAIY